MNFFHSHRSSDRLGGHKDDVEARDHSPLVRVDSFFLPDDRSYLGYTRSWIAMYLPPGWGQQSRCHSGTDSVQLRRCLSTLKRGQAVGESGTGDI